MYVNCIQNIWSKLLSLMCELKRYHHIGTNFNLQYEYEQYTSGIVENNKNKTKFTNLLNMFIINNINCI